MKEWWRTLKPIGDKSIFRFGVLAFLVAVLIVSVLEIASFITKFNLRMGYEDGFRSIAGGLIGGCFLTFWLAWLIIKPFEIANEKYKEEEKREERRKNVLRVQSIIDSGGPHTLDETLFIFPDACTNCGFRDFLITTWEITISMGPHASDYQSEYKSCWKCCRCGNERGDCPSGRGETRRERINSPYLTEEQAASIPDLPYNPDAAA